MNEQQLLEPVRSEILSAQEILELSADHRRNILRSRVIPAQLGSRNDWGGVLVEYRNQVLKPSAKEKPLT